MGSRVGCRDGLRVGLRVGWSVVGSEVGRYVGPGVGTCVVGWRDGAILGVRVVGCGVVGIRVGLAVEGAYVGASVGDTEVGWLEGAVDGATVVGLVGEIVDTNTLTISVSSIAADFLPVGVNIAKKRYSTPRMRLDGSTSKDPTRVRTSISASTLKNVDDPTIAPVSVRFNLTISCCGRGSV